MRRFLLPGAALVGVLAAGPGCTRTDLDETVPEDAGADAAPVVDAGPPPLEVSSKVDMLFVIDNSPYTDTFHALLASTVPYLLGRLAQPACVDGLGNVVATTPGPTDPCPIGVRDFKPVEDLRLAVISTSLGGHGADICSPAFPQFDPTQDDGGHLLTREEGGGVVPTYGNEGFLVWDPLQVASPPGDSDLGALTAKLEDMVQGTGTNGCGFASQLESMYRFLVDPEPYLTIPVVNGEAVPTGTDTTVLQQRADFLRPDSALMIVLVTDDDDCSTREGGQYYLSNQGLVPGSPSMAFHLPRPRSACAMSPDDLCCASCAEPTPAGCSPSASDPGCQLPPFSELEDPINLRCFDQKRRFGVDFLYPVERYVQGLSDAKIAARDGSMVDNPLYTGNRSPELVMLTGIVGVPWQDVAWEPTVLATGYRPATELDWSLLLGDPKTGAPPGDPLMIASVDPRTGTNPPTGKALADPSSGQLANPINGHERDLPLRDDLQYACIFPRVAPADCTDGSCPCTPPDIDGNPLCQASDGSYSATALFSRAQPSARELAVLQALGDRATVASVCAAVVAQPSSAVFGYKPAVDGALRTLRSRLE